MYLNSAERVLHAGSTANGDGNIIPLKGRYGTAVIAVTGQTGTATQTFKGSIDEKTWIDLLGTNLTTDATGVTATANGFYKVPVLGVNYLKSVISAYSSGGTIKSIAMLYPDVS